MNLIKNTFIISFFTILSQALGVLRDKLLISIVGVSVMLDIFNASFKIPDLMISIMMAFVGLTVVVPFFTSSIVNNNKKELEKKFVSLFVFFNGVILFISIFIILTLDLYLSYIFPKFSVQELALLSSVTKIMLLQPMLLGTSNLISCLAQANKNFLYYAIAPVFYNVGIILGIVFLYPVYGVYGLVWGVIFGALIHLFTSSLFLIKYKINFNFSYFNFSYIKDISPVALWRSAAFIIISLKQFTLTIFSGLLGAGIISVFTFALNLVNMSVQFFATSYSIASFPILSEYFERKEFDKLSKRIKRDSIDIFLFSMVFSVIIFFFAKFIVGILYNGNSSILELFYILIFAIPFLNLEQYYARAMMAMHKVKLLTFIHLFSFVFLVIMLYVFYKLGYNYTFLAKAYLISSICQVVMLYIFDKLYKK